MVPLLQDIGTYVLAVLIHWQAYATGGVVTGILQAWERLTKQTISRRLYIIIVIVVFFVVASFMTWRDQYHQARIQEPKLLPDIFLIEAGQLQDSDTSFIRMIAGISNIGSPSVVSNWGLEIDTKQNSHIAASMKYFPPGGFIFHPHRGDNLLLKESDALYNKCGTVPIPTGGRVIGGLVFEVEHFDARSLNEDSLFTLSLKDVAGTRYSASTTPRKMNSQPIFIFPK